MFYFENNIGVSNLEWEKPRALMSYHLIGWETIDPVPTKNSISTTCNTYIFHVYVIYHPRTGMSKFHSLKYHTFDVIFTWNVHCFEQGNLATSWQQQITLLQCSDWLQRTMDVAIENNGHQGLFACQKAVFACQISFGAYISNQNG